jgi:hypothetical protein
MAAYKNGAISSYSLSCKARDGFLPSAGVVLWLHVQLAYIPVEMLWLNHQNSAVITSRNKPARNGLPPLFKIANRIFQIPRNRGNR